MIAEFHARAIGAISGAELVAVYDVSAERAEAMAAAHRASGYDDLTAFLDHPRLDIVSIATPSGAHMEPALSAAAAGKHVIVEKPLEVTEERCDRIIEACDFAGVKCAGIFPSRFRDSSILMKRAVEEGRFGTPVMGDATVKWFRSQEYYSSSPWKGTWKLDGGGALMNQSIHSIDLLQWLMGPVESLQAYCDTRGHTGIEVEDLAVAAVRFSSGALGVIQGSTAVHPGFPPRVEIHGTEGSAAVAGGRIVCWQFASPRPEDRGLVGSEAEAGEKSNANDPAAVDFSGHQRQFEDLIDALDSGREPVVDGREAKRAVTLIRAIYRSSKEGIRITL